MPLMEKNHYTIKDIEELPEGERAELIDGQMYMMSPPGRRHQWLSNYLATEINIYIFGARKENVKYMRLPLAYS